MLRFFFIIYIFILPTLSFAQIDLTASKAADLYLQSVKTIDVPESKKI
jgi:hypothetical protein